MRALVIGGTGFIGSNLVQYLSDRGNEVAVYHRSSSSLVHLEGFPFNPIVGELNDEDALAKAMACYDTVFNLAACGSTLKKDHELRVRVNVEAAGRVARLAREKGTIRLVHVSSVAAIGVPKQNQVGDETLTFNCHRDHYALTKNQGEKEVLREVEKGLDAVIACPGNVLGRHAMKESQKGTFQAIANGKMRFYPPGGVCLTDVEDLVRGLALCAIKGVAGQRYILGGHNVSFKDYFRGIADATGGTVPKIRLPGFLLPWLGLGVEIVFNFLGREAPVTKDTGEMVSRNLFYSSQRAVRELGYVIGDWRKAVRKAAQAVI